MAGEARAYLGMLPSLTHPTPQPTLSHLPLVRRQCASHPFLAHAQCSPNGSTPEYGSSLTE